MATPIEVTTSVFRLCLLDLATSFEFVRVVSVKELAEWEDFWIPPDHTRLGMLWLKLTAALLPMPRELISAPSFPVREWVEKAILHLEDFVADDYARN